MTDYLEQLAAKPGLLPIVQRDGATVHVLYAFLLPIDQAGQVTPGVRAVCDLMAAASRGGG